MPELVMTDVLLFLTENRRVRKVGGSLNLVSVPGLCRKRNRVAITKARVVRPWGGAERDRAGGGSVPGMLVEGACWFRPARMLTQDWSHPHGPDGRPGSRTAVM